MCLRATNCSDDIDDTTLGESRQNDMIQETRHEHDRAYSSVDIALGTTMDGSHKFYEKAELDVHHLERPSSFLFNLS